MSDSKGRLNGVDRETVLRMYRMMVTIRTIEDSIAEGIVKGEIGCPCHLYSGEEAVAVGVCSNLRKDDWTYSNHRSHGHFLAKGGSVRKLLGEVYCRRTGASKGRGGSMHLTAPEVGFPGSSAIVAGTISLAVGSALAFRLMNTDRIVVTFFGDGASNEGVFYESLNIAALYKLPVLFVCENNLYSTHMPISKILADTDIAKKARAFGVPATRIDGNDVLAVHKAARRAIDAVRRGCGPRFIECMTYRHRGHVGPNYDIEKGLRSQKELDSWLARDPIRIVEKMMLRSGSWSEEDLEEMRKDIADEVRKARDDARTADWPTCGSDAAFQNACWRD